MPQPRKPRVDERKTLRLLNRDLKKRLENVTKDLETFRAEALRYSYTVEQQQSALAEAAKLLMDASPASGVLIYSYTIEQWLASRNQWLAEYPPRGESL
jgi:hypothetical protein